MAAKAPKLSVTTHDDTAHWDKAQDAADKSGLSGRDYWADAMAIFKNMTHQGKETASATTLPQVVRPSAKKESHSASMKLRCKFKEASGNADELGANRFTVVLIEEGLGNLKDCYYYTREALESAVDLFEGAKEFANHPKKSEEQDRPERDVYDIGGHFENLSIQETDDGRAQLCGELVVPEGSSFERERDLLRHAVKYAEKYPDKSFVGLSINASGDASEVELVTFIKENKIPPSALEKLNDAMSQGIQIIRPVTVITDAVSCDLVTEAGAGGKINQMIEQEKKMSKDKEKKEGHEKKEMEKKEGAMPGEKPDADSPEHADAEQDKALIADMLKKHLGDEDHGDDVQAKAKEAYEAYKEMGMEHEAAMEAAGNAMKLAKHMASKQESKEDGAPAGGPPAAKAEASAKDDGDEDEDDVEPAKDKLPPKKEAEEKKESAKKIITLTAEVARLKESLRKVEVERHVEKTLKESGLPMAVTKKFRECLGTPKSVAEVTEKLKFFTEAYIAGGSEADGVGFVIMSEKNQNQSTGSNSFADCADKE